VWSAHGQSSGAKNQFLTPLHLFGGTCKNPQHGLADEVVLIVSPVLLGTGKRFFAEGTPARSFELVSTQATPSGVILSTYKVAGPLKTG
jgi:hypothetical protein